MIYSFSGDTFLSQRAARQQVQDVGIREVHRLESLSPATIAQAAAQAGLFAPVAIWLEFDDAFRGSSATKARNAAIKALKTVPEHSTVIVIDSGATAARQKQYRALGEHRHQPTPRYGALTQWVRDELRSAGVAVARDVPERIADIFGEDIPAIASEIHKLAIIAGADDSAALSAEQVQQIIQRPASRDAFALLDACAAGDNTKALLVCQQLLAQGEEPPRLMGALLWQYGMLARAVGIASEQGRVDAATLQQRLSIKRYPAQKIAALAQGISEASLQRILETLLASDIAIKTGKDSRWALESLSLALAAAHR